jgi:L,D-peptidoglycan transpeptidase YkuD (ErfK/YbiS/YcfS/YnhG family)
MRLALALALLAACSGEKKTEPDRPPRHEAREESSRREAREPAARETRSPIPAETTQLLVATVDGWDEVHAQLKRFERTPEGWKQVGEPWPAVIGVSGAAWGRGLHGGGAPPGDDGPVKVEGDGRSPAGVFALGASYGYDRAPPPGARLPYTQVDRDWLCIDDGRSAHYNKVLDTAEVRKDWSSFEAMRRTDELYRRVIVVDHNPEPAPGAGSCIFLHLWHGPDGGGTAGCTAMARAPMESLLAWLDPAARPVYVLLPADRAAALRAGWALP